MVGSRPSLEPGDKSRWIEDEVIPNKPSTGTESVAGVGYRQGQDELTDIFCRQIEAKLRSEVLTRLGLMGQMSRPASFVHMATTKGLNLDLPS